MANIFLNLPMPAGDGAGAPVDTSAMGGEKTIVVGGSFVGASVAIEVSTDGVVFQPIWTFTAPGKKVFPVAAQFMRVSILGRSVAPFSATANIGANDAGALFFGLPLPAGDGAGAPVDVSTLGNFTTFAVGGAFIGASVSIQVSEDGVDYATCESFSSGGGIASKVLVANFMRTFVDGRAGNGYPFAPIAAVGATVDPGGGGGGGGITIPHIIQSGDGTASVGGFAAVVIAHGDAAVGVGNVNAAGGGAFATGMVRSTNAAATAQVLASNHGTLAGGYAGSFGLGTAYVRAFSRGSLAFGNAEAEAGAGATARARIFVQGGFEGGFAMGRARVLSGDVNALADINVSASGGFAGGYARVAGDAEQARIVASDSGAFAFGNVVGDGVLDSSGSGSWAGGYILGAGSGIGGGQILASGAGSRAFGRTSMDAASDSRLAASGDGSRAEGYIESTGVAYSRISSAGDGSFASGFSYNARLDAKSKGSHAFGYAKDGHFYSGGLGALISGFVDGGNIESDLLSHGAFVQGAAIGGDITTTGKGSFASGYVKGTLGGVAAITIRKSGGVGPIGSFAQGAAVADGAGSSAKLDSYNSSGMGVRGYAEARGGSDARIFCDSQGGFASGFSEAINGALAVSSVEAGDWGSHAFGMAGADTSGTATLQSDGRGGLVFGYAFATGGFAGTLVGYGDGALAGGSAVANVANYNTPGIIYGYGTGSFSLGYAYGGRLSAYGVGSVATGYVYGGNIEATVYGAFAHGMTYGTDILASGNCAVAIGFAVGANITASGAGSFAQGQADAAPITASAINSVQFGEGVNSVADSVQVGNAGIRFHGKTGAPGAPQNGDMWLVGADVFIHTGGVSKNISSLT
jgi:hypothetical protein